MRTVLLTGGTGAIGSALAKCLVLEPATRVRLLLRARSAPHLEERLQGLYRFWGIDPREQSGSGQLEAMVGDVTAEKLGLSDQLYRRLTTEVTHVIHSAGNVKLNRPLDEARRSAVDSARHVVAFVEGCRQHGAFQKLDLVSTVGVAGRLRGTVPEQRFDEPRSFRNSYEAAKAEAETYVLGQIDKGFPATIHRPSMVVGDSKDGAIIQFQVFYYLCEFLSGRRTAGIIPNARDIRLDIVPVDYVARAIQLSSQRDDAVGRIFHLCAGPIDAPQIVDLARRIRRIFVSHGRRVPTMRPVSPAWIRTLLPVASRLAPGDTRRALESLPYFLEYLDAPQTFANVRSQEYFSAAGITVPPVDTYLDAVLSYYLHQRKAPAESSTHHSTRGAA